MNYVMIIGRLTKAPEQRQTQNGVSVTTFTLAVNHRANREVTDFFNVVTWRGLAENCAKYLSKGQQVAVVGELQTRSYTGGDGAKRYVTEINAAEVEFLAKASGTSQADAQSAQQPSEAHEMTSAEWFAQSAGLEVLYEEPLPF